MVYYVAFYGNNKCKDERLFVLSATNKIDYLSSVINRDRDICIISASQNMNRKVSRAYSICTDEGVPVEMLTSIGRGNHIRNYLDKVIIRMQLILKLLKLTDHDCVFLYHSLAYIRLIRFTHRIRKYRLVVEVEELYSDFLKSTTKQKKREIAFLSKSDGFMFSTELLDTAVNKHNKPSVICHGAYIPQPVYIDQNNRVDDGKIHVVYSGTFDPRKGGAAAVAAAAYLPAHYHLHILGFGSDNEVTVMKRLIDETSAKICATVTYDGCLSGEEYNIFLQKCEIGLSTQNPDAAFNDSSFPSKILTYMSNGLRVVSIRIPAIEQSSIGKHMYYYEKQTPEEIVKTILSINMNDGYDGRAIVHSLDTRLYNELHGVLS